MNHPPATPRVRSPRTATADEFPLTASVGAAIRFTHRAFAEDLQARLAAHEVTTGMWFLLRSLWEEDGLTQRELSRRAGITEPTALQQLRKMENQGYIERRPSRTDRRKVHIHLTRAARRLRKELLPYAMEVNAAALEGLNAREIKALLKTLDRIRGNLQRRQSVMEQTGPGLAQTAGGKPTR